MVMNIYRKICDFGVRVKLVLMFDSDRFALVYWDILQNSSAGKTVSNVCQRKRDRKSRIIANGCISVGLKCAVAGIS